MTKRAGLFFCVAILLFCILNSCRKDDIIDKAGKLEFSTDTLIFDTVFTTVGSITEFLVVRNPSNNKIVISSIRLAGNSQGRFSMNVDGVPGNSFKNVEIRGNDSIFIFVRVTVDPDNQNTPFIITDSIIFQTNGSVQDVDLVAWGQNAYYHTPTDVLQFSDGSTLPYSFAHCNGPWPSDKPHVIYGYTVVDSDSTLVINANTQIHFHKNAVLWVYDGGTLKVNGSKDSLVVFQGDRLGYAYSETPGQWGFIWLSEDSKNNEINYALIKNGFAGLLIDKPVSASSPVLRLKNTVIRNMSGAGIWARGTWIEAENCIIANCRQHAVILSGGEYDFRHCTIGNYWSESVRQTPSLVLNDYFACGNDEICISELNTYFGNCIVYGNIEEEILTERYQPSGIVKYKFDHCLVKTTLSTSDGSLWINCLKNTDPLFKDVSLNDYHLQENSPARDKGVSAVSALIPFDIDGTDRNADTAPDIGAYEYKP